MLDGFSGALRSSANNRFEDLIREQGDQPPHDVHVDLGVPSHPNVTPSELVLEAAVASLGGSALLVALFVERVQRLPLVCGVGIDNRNMQPRSRLA